MRIVKLFKENTTFLTSVIVAFTLGMGFAYALSAYFLAWEYSPEAVEALSALGVFLTPIVALWIFTRWRQQRHSQIIMDQVVTVKDRLTEWQLGICDYAVEVLGAFAWAPNSQAGSQEAEKIKRDSRLKLWNKSSNFKSEACKLINLRTLHYPDYSRADLSIDKVNPEQVFEEVDQLLIKLKAGEFGPDGVVEVGKKVLLNQDKNLFELDRRLAEIYKKG